jgi:hypothetical protein
MTWKQMKKLREDYNKHQSETKNAVKREVHELRRTKQIIKQKMNKGVESHRRKNQTEIRKIKCPYSQTKNTLEDHSSRLQMEYRISELKGKIESKENTKEILVKQLKSCETNM